MSDDDIKTEDAEPIELKTCRRCKETKAGFRFTKEHGRRTNLCYECRRQEENSRRGANYEKILKVNPYDYESRINKLKTTPEYKKFMQEHQIREAQFGNANLRGVGRTQSD